MYNTELGIFDRMKNDELCRLYDKPNILSYIKDKRMEWFGHLCTADNDIINKALTESIHKKKKKKVDHIRDGDAVKDIKMLGRNMSVDLAFNRETWRELLLAAQVLHAPLR